MNQELLEPRLIIATGYAATGKSTTIKEVCKMLPNAFVLEKDILNNALLHLPLSEKPRLPSVIDYIARDDVLYDKQHISQTVFGEMLVVTPNNDYYRRHALLQVPLAMIGLARFNMDLGKIPIIDCMTIPDYKRGAVRKVLNHANFELFPRFLIHFTAEEEDLYQRMLSRLQSGDPNTVARDAQRLSSIEAFHHFTTEIQPLMPQELETYQYLLINTTKNSPEECALKCLDYISNSF